MVRRDITENRQGVALQLRLTVQDVDLCQAIEEATVEVWRCDAVGVYSGFTSAGAGGGDRPSERPGGAPPPSGPPPGGWRRQRATDRQAFLRGAQRTDAAGPRCSTPSTPAGIRAAPRTSTSRST